MRVKTAEKREEIVAVARQLFRERGYAEASMAEIAARLGGSKGTLYSYFSSKEDLFVSVMLDMATRSAGALHAELERSGDMRDGLAPFMQKLIGVLCSPEVVDFRRMLIAEAGRSQLGKRVYEQVPMLYLKKFAEVFAAHMREGRFREVDAWRAALHMQSLCMGGDPAQLVLEGVIERPPEGEIAAAAQAAADVFLRAYALEPPAPRKSRTSATRKGPDPDRVKSASP
jgi:AcrR family transcriptional regulator